MVWYLVKYKVILKYLHFFYGLYSAVPLMNFILSQVVVFWVEYYVLHAQPI